MALTHKITQGFQIGYIPWNKGKKLSEKHKENVSKGLIIAFQNPEIIKKLSDARKGEKHWNWNGGVSRAYKTGYYSVEYKNWRKSVFELDRYTCQECGQVGGSLNADHIKPFAFFPELRFDISNGRTLCVPCHKKTPTYGIKAREYIKNIC